MPLYRSVAILVLPLILLVGCGGEPEDKTPWVMWQKISSKKVMGVVAKWKPIETYEGRAKCQGALGKQMSSNEDWLWQYECWPTGTTPQ